MPSPPDPNQDQTLIHFEPTSIPPEQPPEGLGTRVEVTATEQDDYVPSTRHIQIPGYDILGVLGHGGMGVVYRAHHQRLKRDVALKMILAGEHADPALHRRLRIEAEAVARLQHPNIVQIYEVGEHQGLPFLALEYVPDGTLDQRLDGQPMAPRLAAEVIVQLAHAIHYAHQQGVVHRDLKPANVLLLDRDRTKSTAPMSSQGLSAKFSGGLPFVPKVTDFGLAKRLDSLEQNTATGSVMGTPNYMAPEQAQGLSKAIGPTTDVWALGAILYELLTGRPPFLGATPMETLLQVIHNEPVPPLQLQPRLPHDLNTICLKCLQREQRKRYASAQELADDLQAFLDDHPIKARPTGLPTRMLKWIRRNPTLASLGVFTLVVLLGLLGFFSYHSAELQTLLTEVEEQRDEIGRQRDLARRRVMQLHISRGMLMANEARYLEALPFLAEALHLDLEDPRHTQLNRLRLGGVLDRCPRLVSMGFHPGRVIAGTFSPDGRLAATVGSYGLCRIMEADSGTLLQEKLFTVGCMNHVEFSPDNQRLLMATEKGGLLWNFRVPNQKPLLLPHQMGVRYAVFAPDGKTIATASDDHTAAIWDLDGKRLATLKHDAEVVQVAFRPDGLQILTASWDHTARLWNAATGHAEGVLHQPEVVYCACYSPDGKRALTGCNNGFAQQWDVKTAVPFKEPMKHNGMVVACTYSRDGRFLATGSEDNTARVWDAQLSLPVTSSLRHGSTVYFVDLSADAQYLLTGSDDNTAGLWRVKTGDQVGTPLRHNGAVSAALFRPGTELQALTTSADGSARLWNLVNHPDVKLEFQHKGPVRQVEYLAETKQLLTASQDGTANLWDVNTGKLDLRVVHASAQPRSVLRAVVSPESHRLLTLGADGKGRLWSTRDNSALGQPLVPGGKLLGGDMNKAGTEVVTAGADHRARLWDVATGLPIGSPWQHEGAVNGAWFSPDGTRVVTACADGTARYWDTTTGKPIGIPMRHREAVLCAAWSPDGTRVITTSMDRTGRVWDREGKPVTPPLQHNSKVYQGIFNHNGQWVATASDDNTARVWNANTGVPITRPLPHRGSVVRAHFSVEDSLLVTASEDSSACVWDIHNGLPVTPYLEHELNVVDAVFVGDSLENLRVATASMDEFARLWVIPADNRPVKDLVRISQLLSGGKVDQESDFIRMDTEHLRQLWDEMHQLYPEGLILTPKSQ